MAYCPNCGKPIPDGAKFCPSCGQASVQEPSGAPVENANPSPTVYANAPATSGNAPAPQSPSSIPSSSSPSSTDGSSNAMISLICGIISIVLPLILAYLPFCTIIALILGIVAVSQANAAKGKGTIGGVQTAGFVLGIIGIILSGLTLFSCVACASLAVGGAGALGSMLSSGYY